MPPPTFEHRLRAAWQRRGPLAWALRPLAGLYGALVRLRQALYGAGWLRRTRLPVPVVVIGNVVAGGAGKTPTTLAVVAHLQARGWRPGIVSRGHGRRTRDVRAVTPGADPRDVGDEPLLLHRRAGVPVVVGRRRAEAGHALLAFHPGVDVLVCDDGLQHLALARDVEIGVFDARGIGNGWLLPAGPLREPWPRPLDLALWTEPRPAKVADPLTAVPATPGFTATRHLAEHALTADGQRVPLPALHGKALTAVAAIARPEAFFAMLRAAGLPLADCIALPDHSLFDSCQRLLDKRKTLICTEKDAAKLWHLRPDALAVPLHLVVPPAFFAALDARLPARPIEGPAIHSNAPSE